MRFVVTTCSIQLTSYRANAKIPPSFKQLSQRNEVVTTYPAALSFAQEVYF